MDLLFGSWLNIDGVSNGHVAMPLQGPLLSPFRCLGVFSKGGFCGEDIGPTVLRSIFWNWPVKPGGIGSNVNLLERCLGCFLQQSLR